MHALVNGTFSTGSTLTPVTINLPSGYDYFQFWNITDWGSTDADTRIMGAEGWSYMPAGYALTHPKTSGAATLGPAGIITSGGFTFISDSGAQTPGPIITNITAITNAAGAVASTITPAAVGSVVRITNSVGMYQIGGWDFTITAVNPATSMTLGYLDASGFSAPGTTASFSVIPYNPRYYPVRRRITSITQAASAVITMSVTHGYTVGQTVRISVPAGWGMTQMNGLLASITAINTSTNSITVNINSTGFTAFAFPTSASAALGTGAPEVTPVGETAAAPYQNLLDDATYNTSFTGISIDPSMLIANKSYGWIARNGVFI
jgi:hypothetical protein